MYLKCKNSIANKLHFNNERFLIVYFYSEIFNGDI
ncbi:hypothetical protein ECTW14313_5481, partial [Escherichia coli O157:H7 str. TW14313]